MWVHVHRRAHSVEKRQQGVAEGEAGVRHGNPWGLGLDSHLPLLPKDTGLCPAAGPAERWGGEG